MPDLTGNAAIDTAVGLFFVFFVLSIVCSAITEMISSVLRLRGRDLERGLRNLLSGDTAATENFLQHPRIKVLWRQGRGLGTRKPSYIPARAVALTLLDTVAPQGVPGEHNVLRTADDVLDDLKSSLTVLDIDALAALRARLDDAKVVTPGLQTSINAVITALAGVEDKAPRDRLRSIAEARNAFVALEDVWPVDQRPAFVTVTQAFDKVQTPAAASSIGTVVHDALLAAETSVETGEARLAAVRKEIETAFDEVMDRASGWFKRRAQLILLVIALVVAGVTNADSFAITQRLYSDPTVRAAVVAQADKITDDKTCPGVTTDTTKTQQATDCVESIEKLGLPFGWAEANKPNETSEWVVKIVGLLLTAAALSLGAPFWFDALGKLAQLRGVGNREGTAKSDRSAVDRDELPTRKG